MDNNLVLLISSIVVSIGENNIDSFKQAYDKYKAEELPSFSATFSFEDKVAQDLAEIFRNENYNTAPLSIIKDIYNYIFNNQESAKYYIAIFMQSHTIYDEQERLDFVRTIDLNNLEGDIKLSTIYLKLNLLSHFMLYDEIKATMSLLEQ